MPRGGYRIGAGRRPEELSGRSDARGFSLEEAPGEGFSGPAPDWPMPTCSDREAQVWAQVWTYPQAYVWSQPQERWRIPTIGLWVRLWVRCERHDAPASLLGQLHRFEDQIGMSTRGLADMGWKVGPVRPVGLPSMAAPQPFEDRPRRARRLRDDETA